MRSSLSAPSLQQDEEEKGGVGESFEQILQTIDSQAPARTGKVTTMKRPKKVLNVAELQRLMDEEAEKRAHLGPWKGVSPCGELNGNWEAGFLRPQDPKEWEYFDPSKPGKYKETHSHPRWQFPYDLNRPCGGPHGRFFDLAAHRPAPPGAPGIFTRSVAHCPVTISTGKFLDRQERGLKKYISKVRQGEEVLKAPMAFNLNDKRPPWRGNERAGVDLGGSLPDYYGFNEFGLYKDVHPKDLDLEMKMQKTKLAVLPANPKKSRSRSMTSLRR